MSNNNPHSAQTQTDEVTVSNHKLLLRPSQNNEISPQAMLSQANETEQEVTPGTTDPITANKHKQNKKYNHFFDIGKAFIRFWQKRKWSLGVKLGAGFLLLIVCSIVSGLVSGLLLINLEKVNQEQNLGRIYLERLLRYELAYSSQLLAYSDAIFITRATYVRDEFQFVILENLLQPQPQLQKEENPTTASAAASTTSATLLNINGSASASASASTSASVSVSASASDAASENGKETGALVSNNNNDSSSSSSSSTATTNLTDINNNGSGSGGSLDRKWQQFERNLRAKYSQVLANLSELNDYIKKGDFETARLKWNGFNPLFNETTALLKAQHNELEAFQKQAEGVLSQTIFLSMLSLALANLLSILFVTFVLWLLNGVIIRPIKLLTQAWAGVAKGNLKQAEELVVEETLHNRDEIGKLASSFLGATKLVNQIVASSQISSHLEEIVEDLKVLGNTQKQGSYEQLTAVVQVLATIEQMNRSSLIISTNTDKVVSSTKASYEDIDRLAQIERTNRAYTEDMIAATTQIVEGTTQMEARVTDFVQTMQILDTKIIDLNRIVGLISEIAGRVHLLAINASIEAAGASGADNGNRFKAVTRNIRELAEHTRQATITANSFLDEVRAESARAYQQVVQGRTEIAGLSEANRNITLYTTRLEESTNAIGAAVNSLVEVASEVQTRTEEVSSSIYQQQVATQQVISSTNAVRMIAENGASMSTQLAENISILNKIAANLREVLKDVK
jgi:methyl-accepting chemotaxis protein